MLDNLLPVMSVDDIGRLAQASVRLKSIVATAEFSSCAYRAVGPIKELLDRARALVSHDTTSHDAWLWDPPRGDPACGGDSETLYGDPIEHERCGLNGSWVRNFVAFLEGNPEGIVEESEGDERSDYEEDEPQVSSRKGQRQAAKGFPVNSRPGIIKRIKGLEVTAPLEILKSVRKLLLFSVSLGLEGQRIAWKQCVRFGLDGMLPLILNAHDTSDTSDSPSRSSKRRTGRQTPRHQPPFAIDDFIKARADRRLFGFGMNRNAFTLAAYLGHTNVLAAVVRMGATCSWDDQGTCIAFNTAIRHNRHDVVRCLCTPKASGGCGLALDLLRRSQRDTVWRTLTDDIGCHQYQMIWLGPNFDPEELRYEGSRGRRRIRSGYVWQ